MKENLFFSKSIVYINTILLFACSKKDGNGFMANTPSTSTPAYYAAPVIFPAADITIEFPKDFVVLKGDYKSYSSPEKVLWKSLSSLSSKIETPNATTTLVTGLQQGLYEFEFTVTDNQNQVGKDTVTVKVEPSKVPSGPGSKTFNNIKWIFPWYNSLQVPDIYKQVPANQPLKLYVQRGYDPAWVEVKLATNSSTNNLYEYFIETRPYGGGMYTYGSLYIVYYGTNISDTPNVRVDY